jgi:hypothetical protein
MTVAVYGEGELTGSLGEFPLADLLRSLGRAGRTGCLEVGDGPDGRIWLHRGRVYLAYLGSGHHLIDGFRRARAITESQFSTLAAEGGHLSPGLGARLMQESADGGDRLRHTVRDLAVDVVFQLQAAPGAGFVFRPDTLHPFGPVLTFELGAVVDDAGRRLGEWREIARELPETSAVVAVARELPPDEIGVALTRDEWAVLALSDGRRTLVDIIGAANMWPIEVLWVTHRLLRAGRLVAIGMSD